VQTLVSLAKSIRRCVTNTDWLELARRRGSGVRVRVVVQATAIRSRRAGEVDADATQHSRGAHERPLRRVPPCEKSGQRDESIAPASHTAASRLAVVIPASVMSGAEEKVPTGGELTLFEAVGPAGLTSFCCVARRRSGMSGVT